MRGLTMAFAIILLIAGCDPAAVGTRTRFGFSVDITNAPPPPRVVFYEEPQLVVIPGTTIYVAENSDYDVCRYGSYWYVAYEGYWYRSSRPDGGFAVVEVTRVPDPVIRVAPDHWRRHPHGGPPGQRRRPGA